MYSRNQRRLYTTTNIASNSFYICGDGKNVKKKINTFFDHHTLNLFYESASN